MSMPWMHKVGVFKKCFENLNSQMKPNCFHFCEEDRFHFCIRKMHFDEGENRLDSIPALVSMLAHLATIAYKSFDFQAFDIIQRWLIVQETVFTVFFSEFIQIEIRLGVMNCHLDQIHIFVVMFLNYLSEKMMQLFVSKATNYGTPRC